ncbi:MAG: DUF1579 domain-containing protein [Gemmatimonadota bacterium]
MRRYAIPSTLAMIVVALPPALAAAQEAEMPTEAEMAAYMAAASPGAEHQKLAAWVGEFEVDTKFWITPGAEPMLSTGKAERKMILGGRYAVEHYEGMFFGQPFEGMGLTGYDNVEKKYVSAWVDNMGTGIQTMSGDYDDQGRLVLLGHYTDPVTGERKTMKAVSVESGDTEVVYMYDVAEDGTENQMMELTYRKKM